MVIIVIFWPSVGVGSRGSLEIRHSNGYRLTISIVSGLILNTKTVMQQDSVEPLNDNWLNGAGKWKNTRGGRHWRTSQYACCSISQRINRLLLLVALYYLLGLYWLYCVSAYESYQGMIYPSLHSLTHSYSLHEPCMYASCACSIVWTIWMNEWISSSAAFCHVLFSHRTQPTIVWFMTIRWQLTRLCRIADHWCNRPSL